jgi:hypothetical protein
MKYHEVVQVTYRREQKGSRVMVGMLDKYHIETLPDWTPTTVYRWMDDQEPVQPTPKAERIGDYYAELPEDWYGLSFIAVGEGFDGWTGGLADCMDSSGAHDTFADWQEDLRQLGDQILDEFQAKYDRPENECTFLTVWSFEGTKDYDGEWDFTWDLIGLLDTKRLPEIVLPATEKITQ